MLFSSSNFIWLPLSFTISLLSIFSSVILQLLLLLLDTFLIKKKYDNGEKISHFTYLYLLKKDIDVKSIIFEKEEIDEIRFINKKEYLNLLENNYMVDATPYCNKILEYMN